MLGLATNIPGLKGGVVVTFSELSKVMLEKNKIIIFSGESLHFFFLWHDCIILLDMKGDMVWSCLLPVYKS